MKKNDQLKIIYVGKYNYEVFLKTADLHSNSLKNTSLREKILHIENLYDVDRINRVKNFITEKDIICCILNDDRICNNTLEKVLKFLHSRVNRLLAIHPGTIKRNFAYSLLKNGYIDNIIELVKDTYIESLETLMEIFIPSKNKIISIDTSDLKFFFSLSPFIKGGFVKLTIETFRNSYEKEKILKYIKAQLNNPSGILTSFVCSSDARLDEIYYILKSIEDKTCKTGPFWVTVTLNKELEGNAYKLTFLGASK